MTLSFQLICRNIWGKHFFF